jgi:hypothetical protein
MRWLVEKDFFYLLFEKSFLIKNNIEYIFKVGRVEAKEFVKATRAVLCSI